MFTATSKVFCQCSAWQAALALSQSATSEDPMIRYAAAIGASEKASNWKLGRKFENYCSCYFHVFFLEGTKVSATIGPYFICFFSLRLIETTAWRRFLQDTCDRFVHEVIQVCVCTTENGYIHQILLHFSFLFILAQRVFCFFSLSLSFSLYLKVLLPF